MVADEDAQLVSEWDREVIGRLMAVRTADVIDALDRYNVHDSTIMHEGIRPLFNDIKTAGVALCKFYVTSLLISPR